MSLIGINTRRERILTPINIKGKRYAFLLPGSDNNENYGNLVFGVRSSIKEQVDNGRSPRKDKGDYALDPDEKGKKALLWSFHIMLYQAGQIPVDRLITYDVNSDYQESWPFAVVSWPYDLGAFAQPEKKEGQYRYRDFEYRRVGLTYQFGRKDPFPRWLNTDNGPKRFIGHNGKEVKFKFHKNVTISMRESIENPMLLVASANGHQWLTEGGKEVTWANKNLGKAGAGVFGFYGLWGGGLGVDKKRPDIRRSTDKTVFDPCPFGFSVPTPGYNATKAFADKWQNIYKFKPNFVVYYPGPGHFSLINTNVAKDGEESEIFGVYIWREGVGVYAPWAVSTPWGENEVYPLFSFYADAVISDKKADQIHRSSPILVRPFKDHGVSEDWRYYINFQNGK